MYAKNLFGRLSCRWKDGTKINLREIIVVRIEVRGP
jgi:hypothetical protein